MLNLYAAHASQGMTGSQMLFQFLNSHTSVLEDLKYGILIATVDRYPKLERSSGGFRV